MQTDHYAHGKLLLTGEYYVLDGAAALAVPTRLGQRFSVSDLVDPPDHANLLWDISYPVGHPPRKMAFKLPISEADSINTGRNIWIEGVTHLLSAADRIAPGSSGKFVGKQVECQLEFDPGWGLGSSSTLVSFLADYLNINPYELLAGWFGGSGYDLACATAGGPILYERTDVLHPSVTPLDWSPDWLEQTYFVYLNRKQNSREGIERYRKKAPAPSTLQAIGELSRLLTDPTLHLRDAAQILESHEAIVSSNLNLPRIADTFPDFVGTVKSLGAWGGDFVWVLSEQPAEKVRAYFNERGYGTFIPYHDLAL